MMDGEWPYLLAMNFAYSYEDGQLIIYLHSAKEGKKLDLLRKDDHVCFEMDYDHEMIPASMPVLTISGMQVLWAEDIVRLLRMWMRRLKPWNC